MDPSRKHGIPESLFRLLSQGDRGTRIEVRLTYTELWVPSLAEEIFAAWPTADMKVPVQSAGKLELEALSLAFLLCCLSTKHVEATET